MNKKFLIFGIVGLFAIGLVAAITYYALFSASFNVLPSVTTDGELEQTLGEVYGGETIVGSPITITNNAPSEREIVLSDDSGSDVEVSYVGVLELTKKDTSTWNSTGEIISINYTVVGNSFEFSGVPDGYTLIYYKDRVVGLEGRLKNPQPAIRVTSDIEVLPHIDDANMDDLADYCAAPDFYNQCKGAKLWVVLTNNINDGTLAWGNWDNFYFETDLIQFNRNGNIIMSPKSSLTIIPEYTPSNYVSGDYTITTTVA